MQLVRKKLVNSSAPIPFVSSGRVTINQRNSTAHRGAATACVCGARASESQLHQTRFVGGDKQCGFRSGENGAGLGFAGDKQCGFRSGENRVWRGDAVSVSGNR